MTQPDPATVLLQSEKRQRARVALIREADSALRDLRGNIEETWEAPRPTWWQRVTGTEPASSPQTAQQLLERAVHARLTLENFASRLGVENDRVDADVRRLATAAANAQKRALSHASAARNAADPDPHLLSEAHFLALFSALSSVPVPIKHAGRMVSDLLASAHALHPLVVELIDELEPEVSRSAQHDATSLAKRVARAGANVLRIVRAEEERGLMFTSEIDALSDTYDPWLVPTQPRLDAERELAKGLRDPVDSWNRRHRTDRNEP